jgi:hypothetical protein
MTYGEGGLTGVPPQPGTTESCWLCGDRQPTSQMVADGNSTATDVRWYCTDAQACTERWTGSARRKAGPGTGSGTGSPR